jgi:hypothetical protein
VTKVSGHIWIPVLAVYLFAAGVIGYWAAALGLPTPVVCLGLGLVTAFAGDRLIRWYFLAVFFGDSERAERAVQASPVLARYMDRSRPVYVSSPQPRTAPRRDVMRVHRRTPAGGRPRGRSGSSSRGSPPDDPDPDLDPPGGPPRPLCGVARHSGSVNGGAW